MKIAAIGSYSRAQFGAWEDRSAPAASADVNLGTKSKIEIFLSAFHVNSSFFPAAMLDTVNKLGHDTATSAGVYRTWVVHGAPFRLMLDDAEVNHQKKWIWAKFAARKGGVKGSFAFFTKEIFDNIPVR